jgi:hypothetical protein
MIAERLPKLAAMSREEKWEVYIELGSELNGQDDPHFEDPETKAAILKLLEERWAHYEAHPETVIPISELKERMKTWKEKVRQSA